MSANARQKAVAALDEWNRTVRLIGDEVQQRKGKRGLPPVDTSSGYLMRHAYDLILRYIQSGGHNVFASALAQSASLPRFRSSPVEDPFRWGLAAIAAQDGMGLSEKEIPRWAARLHYAYSKNVPSEYVVGFLYQSGSSDHVAKLGRAVLKLNRARRQSNDGQRSQKPKQKKDPGRGPPQGGQMPTAARDEPDVSLAKRQRMNRRKAVALELNRKRTAARRRRTS